MASERLGEDGAVAVINALVITDQRGQKLTLRTVERMISSAESVTDTPLLNLDPFHIRNLQLR